MTGGDRGRALAVAFCCLGLVACSGPSAPDGPGNDLSGAQDLPPGETRGDACINGACLGACIPGTKQCTGLIAQTCSATGEWQNAAPCPFLCQDGTCVGQCKPDARQCMGSTPQLCDATGKWTSLAPCAAVCVDGACAASCTPGAKQCSDNVPHTCSSDGQWVAGSPCPYVCVAGACTGTCLPGAKQCSGAIPQMCDATGSWASGAACSYLCSGGDCVGVCTPGARRCSGRIPQTCSSLGRWVDGTLCPDACLDGACTASPWRSAAAANELDILRPIINRYVAPKLVNYSLYKPPTADPWAYNSYYRAVCTQALISLLERLATGKSILPTDVEVTWIKAAVADFAISTSTASSYGGWWLSPSPGFDCLIAASLARDSLDSTTRASLVASATNLADRMINNTDPAVSGCAGSRFSVAGYRCWQKTNRGNTMAEEVGLAASYLAAAYYLFPSAPGRGAWLTRAKELIAYSCTDTGSDSPFEPGQSLVANHQMRPHPAYTQSLLTSFGEIWAVHRQMSGLALTPPSFLPPEARTDAIGKALATTTTAGFALTGPFQTISGSGTATKTLAYDDLSYTVANYPAGSELLIPTTNVGAMAQSRNPTSGELAAYQVRDGFIWKYVCNGGTCDAVLKTPLASHWATIANQALFGTTPLPADGVDALTQHYSTTTLLKSYVYKGDRMWMYTCQSGICTAGYTKTIATQLNDVGDKGKWVTPAPASDLDAVSTSHDLAAGITRVYFFKGNHVWHYRCAPACNAIYDKTLTDFWGQIPDRAAFAGNSLPSSSIRAMTQFFDASNVLVTHVFKGDRVWKYICPSSGCKADFTQRLVDQWRPIRNQLKWASSIFIKYKGVCDWGFDAAVQNSAYAYGALRESSGTFHKDRYAKLHAAQRSGRGMMDHPFFPPAHRGDHWSWHENLVATDNLSVGAGTLADGWLGLDVNGQPLPFTAMYTLSMQTQQHWWHNLLSGFNSAMAFLLLTDTALLKAF